MRKLYAVVLACLLTVTAVMFSGGPAQAVVNNWVDHRSCPIKGTNFVFKYDLTFVHDTVAQKFYPHSVKVTDASGAHYMYSVKWQVDNVDYSDDGEQHWDFGKTKYPFVAFSSRYSYYPKWVVHITLQAWGKTGASKTPTCSTTVTYVD